MPLCVHNTNEIQLVLQAYRLGNDLMVSITGGQAHLGAVALATPRPSRRQPHQGSADAHVLTVSGHKEDLLARAAALALCTALGVPVSVSCGIHITAFTPQCASLINALVHQLINDALTAMRTAPAQQHYSCTRCAPLPSIQEQPCD